MATKTRRPKRAPLPARRAAQQKKIAANILAAQRNDIADARNLCRKLVAELGLATEECDAIDLADANVPETDKRSQAAMIKAVSLAGRATVLRDLSGAMRTLIDLERGAFDLGAADEIEEAKAQSSAIDSITASLARLAGAGTPLDES